MIKSIYKCMETIMKIKLLLENKFKKETGLDYKETEIIKIAYEISDIIQTGGKVFVRFSDYPKLEMNYSFRFGNPIGIYAYNFPSNITNTNEIIKIVETLNSGNEEKAKKILGNSFAFDKKYLIFFTYPNKNLWTFSTEKTESDEEGKLYKDNITYEQYKELLNKIFIACKNKIEIWAKQDFTTPEIFFEKDIIENIYYNDEEFENNIRSKNYDFAIYKITFWIAQNWKEKFFSLEIDEKQKLIRNRNAIVWGKLLRKIGISGISDVGTKTVGGEYSQAVLLHPEKCRMIGIIDWGKKKEKTDFFSTSRELNAINKARLLRNFPNRMERIKASKLEEEYLFDIYNYKNPKEIKESIIDNLIQLPDNKFIKTDLATSSVLSIQMKFAIIDDTSFVLLNIDKITILFNKIINLNSYFRNSFYEEIIGFIQHPAPVDSLIPYVFYNKHFSNSLSEKTNVRQINYNPQTPSEEADMYLSICLGCVGNNKKYLQVAKNLLNREIIFKNDFNESRIERLKKTLKDIIEYKFI